MKKLPIKLTKKQQMVIFIIIIITLIIIIGIFSTPRFPIYKNEINITQFDECLEAKKDISIDVPGYIILRFKAEQITNDDARNLLKKYNLDTSDFKFANVFWYKVDFEGNESEYIKYLKSTGFVEKTSRSHPLVFVVTFYSNITKNEAKEILRSYDNVNVTGIDSILKKIESIPIKLALF